MKWYAMLYHHFNNEIHPCGWNGWIPLTAFSNRPEDFELLAVASTKEELLKKFSAGWIANGDATPPFFIYEFEVEE